MSSSKLPVWLIATMMLLSMGFVLYPQGSANAAKYCAQLRGATAAGHPDCSFSTLDKCRARKAQGRRALLQIALGLPSELALREVGDLRGRAVRRPFAMSALQRTGSPLGRVHRLPELCLGIISGR